MSGQKKEDDQKMNYSFKPFTRNLIFFDSEFSSLDPYKGEILSIGMVTLSGRELYIEIEYDGDVDSWVKKNIIPNLKNKKVGRKEAVNKIVKFVGNKNPYLISYVNQYDIIYLYKLFGKNKKPFKWLPIDFASILFGLGVNPERYSPEDKNTLLKKLGVDVSKYRIHHALDDAKLLREVFLKCINGTK